MISKILKIFNLKRITKPIDLEEDFMNIYNQVKPFTMVSIERLYATYQAIKYVERNNIPGDIVECGVWKGGCSMLMALSLESTNRIIYLYDTFKGMPKPGAKDVDYEGNAPKWKAKWCYSPLLEVHMNMMQTGYPFHRFIQGKVENTIPKTMPDKIAVLRLDTDWYESTLHELTHLYPLLSKGGVLLLDDYGYWKGQRKAADEYFKDKNPLIHRDDYAGRSIVKIDF